MEKNLKGRNLKVPKLPSINTNIKKNETSLQPLVNKLPSLPISNQNSSNSKTLPPLPSIQASQPYAISPEPQVLPHFNLLPPLRDISSLPVIDNLKGKEKNLPEDISEFLEKEKLHREKTKNEKTEEREREREENERLERLENERLEREENERLEREENERLEKLEREVNERLEREEKERLE